MACPKHSSGFVLGLERPLFCLLKISAVLPRPEVFLSSELFFSLCFQALKFRSGFLLVIKEFLYFLSLNNFQDYFSLYCRYSRHVWSFKSLKL